jgi:NAD(P)-dependent dehydrogenase (short-subunit alcohol dehydrogenase family)
VLYVSSKFAVRGLVTALAHELAPEIRVNGVAPGGTLNTDLRGLASLGLGDRSLGAIPGREAELAGRVPLKVALSGADHAWSYVFLASERPRGITGDVVHPDGGIAVRAETVVSLQDLDIDLLKDGMTSCHYSPTCRQRKGSTGHHGRRIRPAKT